MNGPAARSWIFALLIAGAVSGQSVWNTVKEWDSGPSNRRLDVVILGDGYTAAEIPLFRSHVTSFINYWFSNDPVGRYRNLINIWRVEVESQQSGADHPSSCYANPVFVNTALNSTYCTGGTQRCVTADTGLSLMTAVMNVPTYDTVVVLVNDPEYGGCAGTIATATGAHSASAEVVTHELGHSLIGLADEYWSNGTTYTGPETGQVNVTTQNAAQIAASGTKWSHWLNIESVTAHEGCRYFQFGLFRPRNDCKMRSLYASFCPVCREASLEEFWSWVPAIDAAMPATNMLQPYNVTLNALFPAVLGTPLTVEWYVDSVLIGTGGQSTTGGITTASFNPFSTVTPASGAHTVTARFVDPTTWYRKSVRYEVMSPVNWTISDTSSNLRADAFALVTVPARAGETFRVSETISNVGTTANPPARIGYYLSSDATLLPTDAFIGSRPLGSISPGSSVTVTTDLRLPTNAQGGMQRIGIIVDDLAQVGELSESDNRILLPPVTVTAGPMLNVSPFVMNWIVEGSASIDVDFGPTHAGRTYIMLVSLATQATEGLDLGPFVGVLPFTPDDLTTLVLSGALGDPYFNDFVGLLDPAGRATATFAKPAIIPALSGIIVNFAALVTGFDGQTSMTTIPIVSNRAGIFIF